MQNLNQWAIWSILFWSTLIHASQPYQLTRPTFEWKDPTTHEKLLCGKCVPGWRMAKPCTRDTETECKQCGIEQYTQHWNSEDSCLNCRFPCDEAVEEEVTPCDRTHNRVCKCKPGYHNELVLCIKHFKCPPGTGVVEPGNPQKDTQCGVCTKGTFSSIHSSQEPCEPHQKCSAPGLRVNVPGNHLHDAYCTTCRAKKGSGGSGTGDCYEAALDFVAFQLKSPKKLQRLYRMLNKIPPGLDMKKPIEELQLALHSYLIQLKNLHGKEQAWQMVQAALVVNLGQILQKVQKKFSVGS